MNEKYIFIIGVGRSGSKIYRNIFDQSVEVAMITELKFWTPWEKSIYDIYPNQRDRKDINKYNNFLNDLWSGKINGTIWNLINTDYNYLDRNMIESLLNGTDKSPRNFLKCIIESNMKLKNKKLGGAKFPLHFSHLPILFEWFPNSKIIFLIREPHASIISHARNLIKNSNLPVIKYILYKAYIVHGVIEFIWAAKIHNRYHKDKRYLLSRFEDMVTNPEDQIKKICKFCNINFNEEMLLPKSVDSSYHNKDEKGINYETINRWKQYITPLEYKFINLFTNRYKKYFNY